MKKIQLLIISILVLVGYQSCKEDVLPKPKAQLRLEYNEPQYVLMETECPYTFEKSIISKAKINNRCWINLEYPELRASINMTYRPIQNNLNELLLFCLISCKFYSFIYIDYNPFCIKKIIYLLI